LLGRKALGQKKKKEAEPSWALRCALLSRKWPWAASFALAQPAQ